MKSTRCPHCRLKDLPPGYRLHPECVDGWLIALKEKSEAKKRREQQAKAKVERAVTKARKQAIKKRSAWEGECRDIVQKIARLRDRHLGCISCDKPANWDGQWHGSHYRSHGANSVLQFHLWNINRACWVCNKIFSGRIDQYERGLIARYGQDRVDWLDCQNGTFKPPIDYYIKFKRVMGKKLRRLERRVEQEKGE